MGAILNSVRPGRSGEVAKTDVKRVSEMQGEMVAVAVQGN